MPEIAEKPGLKIINSRHPRYNQSNWAKWRSVYDGGERFLNDYLKKFSRRENDDDFRLRRSMTPTPTFAKGVINEIKNAIFTRASDITRTDGPATYQAAINGQLGGIDLCNGSMNWFIGTKILPELLSMQRVGVFVDSFPLSQNPSIAEKGNKHPYFYVYKTEDILNWAQDRNGKYTSLLLKEYTFEVDPDSKLPIKEIEQFRLYTLVDGRVKLQIIKADGSFGESTITDIPEIPFHCFEISDSLLKDVANHQIALLNLESSDIAFAFSANFPLYTEKSDGVNNRFVQQAQSDYQKEFGASNSSNTTDFSNLPPLPPGQHYANDPTVACPTPDGRGGITAGATVGRNYTSERPAWIAPPTEPLKASMSKQDALKNDIRLLVHLSLSNIQSKMASAESKGIDQQGLEAGLAAIGLELEHGENRLAQLFAMYEGGKAATVKYPKQYSLKSASEIKAEVEQDIELRDSVPSVTYKRAMNKRIVQVSLASTISDDLLNRINKEIDASPIQNTTTADVISQVQEGVVSKAVAAGGFGFPPEDLAVADKEHADRLARIAAAQGGSGAARGVPDNSADPTLESKLEKTGKPQRGPSNNGENQ